jgi:hypothetical protein
LEVLLFLLAKTTAVAAQQQIMAYLETYRYVKPQLSGHDLHAMGLTPTSGYAMRFTTVDVDFLTSLVFHRRIDAGLAPARWLFIVPIFSRLWPRIRSFPIPIRQSSRQERRGRPG